MEMEIGTVEGAHFILLCGLSLEIDMAAAFCAVTEMKHD